MVEGAGSPFCQQVGYGYNIGFVPVVLISPEGPSSHNWFHMSVKFEVLNMSPGRILLNEWKGFSPLRICTSDTS